MDVVVEEDAESLLELKEGEEEDDAVVKSITKADVEELLGGSLEEEEDGANQPTSEPKAQQEEVKKEEEAPRPLLPHLSGSRGGRFPPHHRPLMRFFPPRRLPPPFLAFGGGPPPPHFMRPPLRRPLLRHEPPFLPPPPLNIPHRHYNSVSKALSIARIAVQKKMKAEATEEPKGPPNSTSNKPLQSLMSIKTSLPHKLLHHQHQQQRPLLPRPLKRPLQQPEPKPLPPAPLRGGPGQVHSNLRRIQTVDEPPPPKQRFSVSDQLKAVSIAHKPSPTLTRINIESGPPPSSGTRIKISNLPASATFEKMASMTTACGSVKTIDILGEDNSAVIEFMDSQGAENFYRLNNRKMMDLSILNISMI